jgi:hypothetical protein
MIALLFKYEIKCLKAIRGGSDNSQKNLAGIWLSPMAIRLYLKPQVDNPGRVVNCQISAGTTIRLIFIR